ncbi:MAG: hypothetical protein II192_03660, partial [Clostridia bacterium]|nr:hypothetical protein [Clostridia bacterium]
MRSKRPLLFILLSFAAALGCCGCAAGPALPPEGTGALTEAAPTASVPAETAPETVPATEPAPLPRFDETKIAFSFGAVSDVHINVKATKNKGMFTNALNRLLAEAAEKDPNGLRGLVVAGDMVSNLSKGDKSANLEISRFAAILSDY